MTPSSSVDRVLGKNRVLPLKIFAILSSVFIGTTFAQPLPHIDRTYERIFSSTHWQTFFKQVTDNYVKPINAGDLEASCKHSISGHGTTTDDSLIEECIRAAINDLDSNSTYMSAAERKTQIEDSKKKFVGIGLELKAHQSSDGFVEVVSTIRGSPAEKSDLRPGDLIYSIDGTSTSTLTLMESVRVMRGEAGTDMTLLLHRQGVTNPLKFVVTRQPIRASTVRPKLLSNGVAYVRLTQFVDQTRGELISSIAMLTASNGGPLNKLVLDFRNSPGGLLSATVDIAALFVPQGTEVLRVVGQRKNLNRNYRAELSDFTNQNATPTSMPVHYRIQVPRLMVLINGKTGGGAEAVTQLLRETRFATVVGQLTFGFATINTLLALESGAAINLATGVMSSPNGYLWQNRGIMPDLLVPADESRKWEFGDLPNDVQLAAAIALP
jgi:carboxyl-terminal processing protease